MFKDLSTRKLGFWSIYFLSIGATIGTSWIFIPLLLTSQTGPVSIYSWLLAGVMLLVVALTYAEIGAALPQKSAFIRFPTFAYGKFLGYLFGVSFLISIAITCAVEARAIVILLSAYIPGLISSTVTLDLSMYGVIIALLLIVLFFAINYFNLSITLILNNILTTLKVLLLIFLILILLIFAFHLPNFSDYGGFSPDGITSFATIPILSLVFTALMGFQVIMFFSEETKNPQKNIPRAILYSIFTAIVIYFIFQIAVVGAIRWSAFNINTSTYISQNNYAGLWSALNLPNAGADPLKILFLNNIPGDNIILFFLFILTIIAPFMTGLIFNLVGGRALYGMAYEDYFPYVFLKVTKKHNTPIYSLLGISILSMFLLIDQFSFYKLISLFTGFVLLIFLTSGPVLYTLRYKAKELYRPFKIPFAKVLAPLSFIIITIFLFSIGFTDMRALIYIMYVILLASPVFLKGLAKKYYIIISLIIILFLYYAYVSIYNVISFYLSFFLLAAFIIGSYLFSYMISKGRYREYMKVGYWVIPYFLSLLFIVYLYRHGILSELVSVIFLFIIGIITFYLSVRSTLLSEEILKIISTQQESKLY